MKLLMLMTCWLLLAGQVFANEVPQVPADGEATQEIAAAEAVPPKDEQPVFRLKDELEQTGEAKSSSDVGGMIVGLMAVLGIIFVLAWLSKRFNIATPGGNSSMRLVSAMSVGQKEKLLLVEVEGEKLLLGVTPHQISRLKEYGKVVDSESLSGDDVPPKTDFSERMSKLLKAGVSGNEH